MRFGFTDCFKEYYLVLEIAQCELFKNRESIRKELELKLDREIQRVLNMFPRNCEKQDHFGGCELWCDCGCSEGMICKLG